MKGENKKEQLKYEIIKSVGLLSNNKSFSSVEKVFLPIVYKAIKKRFPVYSLLVLATVETKNDDANQNKDGWISLPNGKEAPPITATPVSKYDSQSVRFWQVTFFLSLLISIIIIVSQFYIIRDLKNINLQNITEANTYHNRNNETQIKSETPVTANNITTNNTDDNKDLNNSEKIDEAPVATKNISNTDKLQSEKKINHLYATIRKLEKEQKDVAEKTTQLNTKIEDLEFDNNVLKNKVNILKEKINAYNDVKFELGMKYSSDNNCKGKYLEDEKLLFSTHHNVLIRYVTVVAKKSGSLNVMLRDNTTKKMTNKKFTLKKGQNKLHLNFIVSKGTKHYLAFYGVKLLSYKNCYKFPYSIQNLITLEDSDNLYYPGFYNLKVSAKL